MSNARDPIKRLSGGLSQRLVKSWRLQRDCSVGSLVAGLYVDPQWGIFYARVPEDDEGTLYAAETLKELREQVQTALSDWAAMLAHADEHERIWERMIRIRYDSTGRQVVGEPVTARPAGYNPRSYTDDVRLPTDFEPCVKIGSLTFSRYERSLHPDGRRYDEREWAEDFESRVHRYECLCRSATLSKSDLPKKPSRIRQCSWARADAKRNANWADGESHFVREVPWSEEIWERLCTFAREYGAVHERLVDFLICSDEQIFLQQLSSTRLLTERS